MPTTLKLHDSYPLKSKSMGRSSVYLISLLCLAIETAIAQTFPNSFTQVAVASGLTKPTVVQAAPDGRLFVAQQNGNLRVIKNGALLADPFLQLTVDSNVERGLLGIAFDPSFTTNQYIYLYYTVPTSGTVAAHNRISRFTANSDVASIGSELILLDLDPLSATNHNGGSLAFGPDQKLYVGVGDNANPPNSQNLDNYLGKVLRINPDGSVPSGNPFSSGSEARKRIWAYGLRNPYTLTFQPGTGRFFVNDVGQENWEEINDATTGGQNFGWPIAEGISTNPAFSNPYYVYPHSGPDIGCAITGGTFYNPPIPAYPSLFVGKYFFLDYCIKWISVLDISGPAPVKSPFADSLTGLLVSLTVGTDGNLYYLSYNEAKLFKIIYRGETCQTTKNGDWHDSAIWSCGHVPIISDQAVVRHAVTIGTGLTSLARQITYEPGGQLTFLSGQQLRLGLL
ncbi:PQQ-dependent sugar dehydrogenase [Spirosoma migulaei]